MVLDVRGESLISPLVAEVYACLCAAFEASARPVCRCTVYHGFDRPPMENCDNCSSAEIGDEPNGMAWVRLVRMVPVFDPTAAACCIIRYSAIVEVGVYRCIQGVPGPNAEAPEVEAQVQDAFDAYADVALLRQGLACLGSSGCEWPMTLVAWEPIGPAGGMAGSAIQIQMELNA